MTHRRNYQVWFGIPGAVTRERPRSLEAAMMAVVIFVGVIATHALV